MCEEFQRRWLIFVSLVSWFREFLSCWVLRKFVNVWLMSLTLSLTLSARFLIFSSSDEAQMWNQIARVTTRAPASWDKWFVGNGSWSNVLDCVNLIFCSLHWGHMFASWPSTWCFEHGIQTLFLHFQQQWGRDEEWGCFCCSGRYETA